MRSTKSSGRWSASIPMSRPWWWRARGRREAIGNNARESTGLGRRGLGKRLVLLFRPGDVVGDDGHDRYARHADKNLREQRARAHHQFEMSDKGQEHADAEYGERLLAADDEGIEHLPFQARPVLRHE